MDYFQKKILFVKTSYINGDYVKYEHGYFEPISSGWVSQFFSAHFRTKCRMSIRVGAFDRYTLLHEKNMEMNFTAIKKKKKKKIGARKRRE